MSIVDRFKSMFGKQEPEQPDVRPDRPKKAADEDEIVRRCYKLFEEFRQAYVSEWARQDHNERLYRCEHWEEYPVTDDKEPRPTTPLVQAIAENVQADLMDGFPQAVIRPESPEDNEIADVVGALIAQNHDAQNFRSEYMRMVHDLLIQGWCVAEVGYDTHAYNNIGMGFIRWTDCRTTMFDPLTEDIQDGRAVFKVQQMTINRMEQMYPRYKGQFLSDIYDLSTERDRVLYQDDSKNLLLIEYWWREYDADAGLFRVHMCKCAGHKLLEDSRRAKPEGYYRAGTYPFVVTTMLRRKGSPLGLGFGDEFGATQVYTDKLDQIILENALMAAKGKLLVARSSGFDLADLQDWSKEVHEGDSLAGIQWLEMKPLPQHILNYAQILRQTARDESGANDFSRGNTASGVTAASAIAALQEASGKRSRMISRLLHESYKEAVRMEIDFEREYNVLPRTVMVMHQGRQMPYTFQAAMLERESQTGVDVPIEFFISIKVEQERRYQTATQNEFVLQLAQLDILTPEQIIENMEFEGKDQVLKQMAEQKEAQQAAAEAAQAGGQPPMSPEEEQAMQAQAQAEQQMQGLPSPDQLAAGGAPDETPIVMQ